MYRAVDSVTAARVALKVLNLTGVDVRWRVQMMRLARLHATVGETPTLPAALTSLVVAP